jgi:hypothetical protein
MRLILRGDIGGNRWSPQPADGISPFLRELGEATILKAAATRRLRAPQLPARPVNVGIQQG